MGIALNPIQDRAAIVPQVYTDLRLLIGRDSHLVQLEAQDPIKI